MTSATYNYFFRVRVNLVRYSIGGLTPGSLTIREVDEMQLNLVNKPVFDGLDDENETYWPILTSIGEVTLAAGDILPSASISEIVINNAIGSFGEDRKISDLLERYNIVGQQVTIYIGEATNLIDNPLSWTVIGTGKVSSWTTGLNAIPPTLTLEITPFKISDRVLSLEIASEVSGMEAAPISSIGKPLSLVLCKRDYYNYDYTTFPQVVPIRITGDGQPTARYAICSLQYQHTRAGFGLEPIIYVKKSWEDQADVWTSVGLDDIPLDYTADIATDPVSFEYLGYGLKTYSAVAYKIPTHQSLISDSYKALIVTGIRFAAVGQSTDPTRVSSGRLSVSLLRVRKNTNAVVGTMTSGQIVLANYDQQNNNGDIFDVKVSFDQPAVIDPGDNENYDFYFSWEYSNSANQTNDFTIAKYDGGIASPPPTYKWLFRDNSSGTTSNTAWRTPVALDSYLPAFQLMTATGSFNEHVEAFTRDGLTYASMELLQDTPDSGQISPALDSIEIIIPVEGLYTYATFEGLNEPQKVVEHLSYTWSGEEWVDEGSVNVDLLKSTHYDLLFSNGMSHRARFVAGMVDTKVTFQELLTQIARGTASRVGVTSDGQIYLYPWGISASPAFIIAQEDIIPLSWEARNDATIVNRVTVTADKIYNVTNNQREEDGFALSIDYGAITYLPVEVRTIQSRTLYGVRSLSENQFQIFGYNNEAANNDNTNIGIPGYLTGQASTWSVDFLADYYISRFALPMTYCSFVVPYHRYKNIKMFDVINFSHPGFPAFYGTSPDARPGVVDDGSEVVEVPNANNGEEFVRAKTYRGLVEAVSYVLAMEHAPAIRLTVQVILNRQYDPT